MKVKPIAFYLPQYHQIPENDKWWGKGFTEWSNVRKAKPLFKDHYQPHVPHNDIGYYDLSDVQTSIKQAQLAKQYGIYGLCYYYYWFNGKKLLDKPLSNMLQSPEIDLPFCLCWANENWTRTWDGQEKHVLMPQDHLPKHDQQFIDDVMPILKDERYIRIDGRPVLVIYRTSLFPNMQRTAQLWQKTAKDNGLRGVYLIRVEGLEPAVDPAEIGFDAAIEFAPDWRLAVVPDGDNKDVAQWLIKEQYGIDKSKPILRDYELTMYRMINSTDKQYKYFRGVFPSWDNTARKGARGVTFLGSDPKKFEFFLGKQIALTMSNSLLSDEEKIVFINAWNEWGEGCHLEPDEHYGYAYLEAVKRAQRGKRPATNAFERSLNERYSISYIQATMQAEALRKQITSLEMEKAEISNNLREIVGSRAWKSVEKYRKSADWIRQRRPKR